MRVWDAGVGLRGGRGRKRKRRRRRRRRRSRRKEQRRGAKPSLIQFTLRGVSQPSMHDSFRVLLFPHSLAVFSVSLPHFLSLFSAFGVKKQEFRRHFLLRFLVQDSNKNRLFSPRFSSRETEAGETEEEEQNQQLHRFGDRVR